MSESESTNTFNVNSSETLSVSSVALSIKMCVPSTTITLAGFRVRLYYVPALTV